MNAANAQTGDWLGLESPATEGDILRMWKGASLLLSSNV
jgi:hypothetical protein